MIKYMSTGYVKIEDEPAGGGAKISSSRPSNFKVGKSITGLEFATGHVRAEEELEREMESGFDPDSPPKGKTRGMVSQEKALQALEDWLGSGAE